jgi:addiction module HigA family antidote
MAASKAVVHPGRLLAEQLAELGLSASEFAGGIKVPPNRVTQILNGQRAITADTALRLAHFFGNSPMHWMNLQSLWDLAAAHRLSGKEIKTLATVKEWQEMNGLASGGRGL